MKKAYRCEICGSDKESIYVKHHIHSRSLGGGNKSNNIARICSNCHADVHNGLVIIEGRFFSSEGDILVHRRWNEKFIINEKCPEIWLYPNALVKTLQKNKEGV